MEAMQLDYFGIFVGMVPRQPSPLENGVWLVPGGAVIEPPLPTIPVGQFARLVEGTWQILTANDVTNVRNAYQLDSLGFFLQFVPKMNYFNGSGYTYPDGVQDSPAVPVIPNGQYAQLVAGVWSILTQEQMMVARGWNVGATGVG